MNVGDLVRVVSCDEPFHLRPGEGSVGMIVEIREYDWIGICYYVFINNVGWRYTEEELEIINNGSG